MANALAPLVEDKLQRAARRLGTANPVPLMKGLLERTFTLPQGDPRYANNALTPHAAPFEPSFSALEAGSLRFNLQPLEPGAAPIDRRDEATREMRRLVSEFFGLEALRWFDERSEPWRGSCMSWRRGCHWFAHMGT